MKYPTEKQEKYIMDFIHAIKNNIEVIIDEDIIIDTDNQHLTQKYFNINSNADVQEIIHACNMVNAVIYSLARNIYEGKAFDITLNNFKAEHFKYNYNKLRELTILPKYEYLLDKLEDV